MSLGIWRSARSKERYKYYVRARTENDRLTRVLGVHIDAHRKWHRQKAVSYRRISPFPAPCEANLSTNSVRPLEESRTFTDTKTMLRTLADRQLTYNFFSTNAQISRKPNTRLLKSRAELPNACAPGKPPGAATWDLPRRFKEKITVEKPLKPSGITFADHMNRKRTPDRPSGAAEQW